ncbi:unnamed protein product [Cunninghamella blakesleeana]
MSNLASFLEKGLTIANAVLESQQQMHSEETTTTTTSSSRYDNDNEQGSYTTKTTTTTSSSSSTTLEALNKLFSSAEENMESEQDKQILNHLKTQVTQLFNNHNNAYTTTKKTSQSTGGYHYAESDEEEEEGYAERAEHAHLKQLANDYNTYDKGDDESASDNDDDDNNNNDGEVRSRGINRNKNHQKGNDGFYTIKKQRHHASNYRKQVCYNEFRPQYLDNLPERVYCMPMFFPSEESYNNFNSVLASAQQKLHIAIFSLTDNATANVLIDAKERGVDVRIVCDNDQLEAKGADIIRLNQDYGIPFKTDSSAQFMHNKFAVIDGKVVITGSFNWSIGARFKNRENIVITNIPEVAKSYQEEFEKLWQVIEKE